MKFKRTRYIICLMAAGCLSSIWANAQTPSIPVPQQTDQISQDPNANGKADPGDKIRYKTTIQNTGTGNATGVKLQANPDPRTTLDGTSFRTSPVAANDGPYTCTGNVGITVPAASGVKANDYDDALASATLSVVMAPTNGTVTLNNDGSFTYTPNAGYTGNDQFTYEISDVTAVAGHTPASADIRGTVTITVSNMIWFIDNSSVAATSDGRLNTPFKTLAAFNSSSTAAGDVVYIEHTGTNYTGGIVLQNNERLFGKGHTGGANLADVLPFTLAANSIALPAINGSRPVIENSGGDGVTLADGNILRGFNVGACSDFGIENSGTASVGNLVASEVTINNTTGGGFDASHGSGASMNAVFDAISSSGGTNGINLTSCGGTFTCNGGTITNPTGTGVLISGGTVTFASSGAVTDNSGFAVDVDNHDSANGVTFSGNITSTGTGIRVQNCGAGTKLFSGSSKSLNTGANTAVTFSSNTGATVNFTGGGLAITTTSGTGFSATGGGTVTVQGTGNTIASTTGTALNVASTTIGASGLTFQSISANGAVNGIVLNTTGSSGGLTVTGDGGGSNNGSGGTIQNCTGVGVSLTSTSSVSLNYMNIQNGGDDGVRGASVTNFSMNRSNVTNNGNAHPDESGLDFGVVLPATLGLTGTSNLTNCSFTSNYSNQVQVFNNSGTLNMTVTGCTINGRAAENNNNDGMLIQPNGTATINISVTSCSFAANKGDHFQAAAANSGNMDVDFKSNMLTGGHSTALGQGITIGAATGIALGGYDGTVTYDVDGNNINSSILSSITIAQGTSASTAVFSGFVRNNIIGTSGTALSGSAQGNGIYVYANGDGSHTSSVVGNTIRQCYDRGILLEAGDGSATFNITVQSNIIDQQVGVDAREAIQTNFGITSTNVFGEVDAPVVCLQLGGAGALANTFSHGGGAPDDFRLRKRHNATVRLPGYGGGTGQDATSLGQVVAFIQGQNTGSAGEPGSAAASGGGGGYTGGAACNTP